MTSGEWLTITEGVLGKYCQARDPALILANQENDKYVITKDLDLQAGDVIQFKVNTCIVITHKIWYYTFIFVKDTKTL